MRAGYGATEALREREDSELAKRHPELIRLFQEVSEGRMPLAYALQLASEPRVAAQLDDNAYQTFTRAALDKATLGDWREGVLLCTLVSTSLASDPDRYAGLAPYLTAPWIHTLALALWHVADPRVYDRAMQLAVAVEPMARASGNRLLLADLYFALGILHLDPIAAERGSPTYDVTVRQWMANNTAWDGASVRYLDRDRLFEFPRILKQAQAYLRASALCYGAGPGRGLALKALAQAIAFRPMIDLPARPRALRRTAAGAIENLTGSRHDGALAEAYRFLRAAEEQIGAVGTPPAEASSHDR